MFFIEIIQTTHHLPLPSLPPSLLPPHRQLGSGAYGMVISALDTQTGQKIAIKKCANLFVDPIDARKIGREIRIMSQLAHPNIIKVVDVLPPQTADFDDVYMVGELMDVDLHRAIYYGRPLSAEHVQFFLYQLLCGIKYIHSVGIVHRDLKVSNSSLPPSLSARKIFDNSPSLPSLRPPLFSLP